MFVLISPAKKLLSINEPYIGDTTRPLLAGDGAALVRLMRSKSVADIAKLMSLSQDLAQLNFSRYQSFNLEEPSLNQSYPALFLFQGDVYQGLKANTWSAKDIDYAQSHLGILSGLYGILRPLDRIQPYRLEMGTRLNNESGSNLYAFWRDLISKTINELLSSQENPILINLASEEYFKSVDLNKLKSPVININFYEQKNNELKIIGIHAKKARGLMTKFIIQNQINNLDGLKMFNDLGYCFKENPACASQMDFIRVH